jgi:hypothetical protein
MYRILGQTPPQMRRHSPSASPLAASLPQGCALAKHRAGASSRRAAARADYEHAAVIGGNTWRGTFGHYQPAP